MYIEIQDPGNPRIVPVLRSLPRAQYDAMRRSWQCRMEPEDVPTILSCAVKGCFRLPQEVIGYAQELVQFQKQYRSTLPEELFNFQKDGVVWLASRRRALLGDQPGVGKTPQALCACAPPVLVIAPAYLKKNWERHVKVWRPDLSPVIISGRKNFRWPTANEVLITNYELLEETPPPLPYRIDLIIDECHMVSHAKTQRTKNTRAATRKILQSGGRVWGLTGTPLMNRPVELWTTLGVLDLAADTYRDWPTFVRIFNGWKAPWGGYLWPKTPSTAAAPLLHRAMLRRMQEDVEIDLPSRRYARMTIDLEDEKIRHQADETLSRWIASTPENEIPHFEDWSRSITDLARAKIPALLELVADYEEAGTPLIVFSAHRDPIDTLGKRKGWGVITGEVDTQKRDAIKEKFQAGDLIGLACTIRAAGVGLDFHRASHAIFVDLEPNPAINDQAEGRLARIGQTSGSVLYTLLEFDHELDRRISRILWDKTERIKNVVKPSRPPELEVLIEEYTKLIGG